MGFSLYSFTDISAVISHPALGQFSMEGAGIGSITVAMANDRSAHDLAADGEVMISKIRAGNGVITLSAQQASPLHRWLQRLSNYLDGAPTDEWAEIIINIRAPKMAESTIATGVSFQKTPDKPYQQQGQQVAWPLMAANIQQLPL
jgi:hypothetical protein